MFLCGLCVLRGFFFVVDGGSFVAHDLFSLEGKTIAVVGAGSGIGEAIALGAADQGAAYVACLDLNEAGAAATAAQIQERGGKAGALAMDIADAGATRDCLDRLAATHGALDGLVCTPSINVRKPILAYSGEEFDRVVRINLRGNFNVLQAAGRIMTTQRRGSIVLYSSIRSIVTEPGQSVYSMTKAGILQLAKTAATEWGTLGVRVNAVGPGVVETPLTAPIKSNPEWYDAYARKSPMQRWAQPGEMVGPTLFLLSDAASYVTGTIIYADGGWLAADGRFTPPGM
jgi:NAD(P)-dependent dehydrogenase (short-subunit alcohol dehydrogenase family)